MRGFTLIELLVVISIMAILGAFTITNFHFFGEDKELEGIALDIQSLIRVAQTNATTNLKCNTQSGAIWQFEYSNASTINLKCLEPSASPIIKKTMSFESNIVVQSFSGNIPSCPSAFPVLINFAPLDGKINFQDVAGCTILTTTIKNNKSGYTKTLTIDKGGRVYAQ